LTKVAVGCASLEALQNRIARRISGGRIDIVCSAELVVVPAKPRRAHQGWRYLEDEDAPSGEADGSGLSELPPRLYGKLAALALV